MIFDPTTLKDYADRLEAIRLYDEFLRADNTYEAFKHTADARTLDMLSQEALDAYTAHCDARNVDLLIGAVDKKPIRCALTGVPLLAEASDSQWVLSAALGLPPRKEEVEEKVLEEVV